MTSKLSNILTHCPVCSFNFQDDFIDVNYPVNRTRDIYQTSCDEHNGGCGRVIYGNNSIHSAQRFMDLNNVNESELTSTQIYNKMANIKAIKSIKKNLSKF